MLVFPDAGRPTKSTISGEDPEGWTSGVVVGVKSGTVIMPYLVVSDSA